MRYGTFLCWLFGHKFIGYRDIPANTHGFNTPGKFREMFKTEYCVRCGIKD